MRKFTTALFAATLMAGCSSTPKADSELELAQKSPHLAAIPAETPYALASLQPMPMGEMVDMLGQLGTAMDALSGQMAATLTPQSSTPERFVVAYLEEFRGKWNREGLESLGFSMSPRTAVYGISWLPVFRYETKDPEAMKGLIQRIETRAGLTSTEQKIGEYSYKAYAADAAVFALWFHGNGLVMGFTPTSTAELYLPYLVGEKKPADNILKSRALEVLTEKYGFKPYFLGFVDIERIVQMLVAPQPGLNEDIAARLSPDRDLSMSPVCQSEVRALAAKYPRMVMGYDEWTATQFSARGGLEMTNGLGTKLAKTRTSIPASNSTYAKDAMAAFGAGVDMGALIQVAAEMANAHRETPFQCDQLAEFNQAAEQFGAVSMMIPPVISQLQHRFDG